MQHAILHLEIHSSFFFKFFSCSILCSYFSSPQLFPGPLHICNSITFFFHGVLLYLIQHLAFNFKAPTDRKCSIFVIFFYLFTSPGKYQNMMNAFKFTDLSKKNREKKGGKNPFYLFVCFCSLKALLYSLIHHLPASTS